MISARDCLKPLVCAVSETFSIDSVGCPAFFESVDPGCSAPQTSSQGRSKALGHEVMLSLARPSAFKGCMPERSGNVGIGLQGHGLLLIRNCISILNMALLSLMLICSLTGLNPGDFL